MSERQAEREQRVTPLELFFDLVFVFAFTQVTTVLSDDPTWGRLGQVALRLRVARTLGGGRPPPPERHSLSRGFG